MGAAGWVRRVGEPSRHWIVHAGCTLTGSAPAAGIARLRLCARP